jgi:hypothetical protein
LHSSIFPFWQSIVTAQYFSIIRPFSYVYLL